MSSSLTELTCDRAHMRSEKTGEKDSVYCLGPGEHVKSSSDDPVTPHAAVVALFSASLTKVRRNTVKFNALLLVLVPSVRGNHMLLLSAGHSQARMGRCLHSECVGVDHFVAACACWGHRQTFPASGQQGP